MYLDHFDSACCDLVEVAFGQTYPHISGSVTLEITGSIGMTGAVDGALILKRERGQSEAMLYVTGRDIEQDQQLALVFDRTTAIWTLAGDVEEFRRTKERQAIIDVLTEQLPGGMTPRQTAEPWTRIITPRAHSCARWKMRARSGTPTISTSLYPWIESVISVISVITVISIVTYSESLLLCMLKLAFRMQWSF